jgi:hypothetical protein
MPAALVLSRNQRDSFNRFQSAETVSFHELTDTSQNGLRLPEGPTLNMHPTVMQRRGGTLMVLPLQQICEDMYARAARMCLTSWVLCSTGCSFKLIRPCMHAGPFARATV